MFEALVLACLISNPNECYEFVDTRGPYITRSSCIKRTKEMRDSILTMPDFNPQAFKCRLSEGGTGI